MKVSLMNDKKEYLLYSEEYDGYCFIEQDRLHKYYADSFSFGFWQAVWLIICNPEDKLEMTRKIL